MNSVSRRLAGCLHAASCFTLLSLAASNANSATVLAVGTSDLAVNSGFVFQGKVTERWVAQGSRKGSIVTHLRFAVSDVLKGDRNRQSVVLSFLGGTLNGRTLRVEGLKLPSVGEEGIYFVSDPNRDFVQPFYGWDQGRFLVQADANGRIGVYTHDLKPVRQVTTIRAAAGIATNHAAGIEVARDEREALSPDSFKSRIRDLVEARQ